MINVIGIIKNSNNDKENIIIEKKDYKTMIFNEQKINKNSTNSYLKFDNILNLYKSLPTLNNNIIFDKLNIIISKNINESIKLLFNSINSGIIDKLIYERLLFPCMITKYIYNTKLVKTSSFISDKDEYINYIKNNFNTIKGHLYLEIKTVSKVYYFLLLNLEFRNKSFYNMIYYLNIKKNKKLDKIEEYDSLIIRNINKKLLKKNINVYFLLDNNIKNKNEINTVLKYYFKLITENNKLKPITKKNRINIKIKKKNIKSPNYKYKKDILPKIKTNNDKYLDFNFNDILSDDDSDDDFTKNYKKKKLYEPLFVKNNNSIIKKNYNDKDNFFIINNNLERIKYLNNRIDYISNIINNKNKDNFKMINQLLYKRIILNKLNLEEKISQKDFLDIVKKTKDELKTYIKSLNSILI